MDNDPFRDPKLCIEHAKFRIQELEKLFDEYIDAEPYKLVVEPHQPGFSQAIKVKLTQKLPHTIQFVASEAFNQLRFALDQTGFACAVLSPNKKTKKANFPFGDTEAEVLSRRAKCKDLPENIFQAMVACKPYKGGNDSLWALNKICNANKHAFVLPSLALFESNHLEHAQFENGIRFAFPPKWDASKSEIILAEIAQNSRYHIKVRVNIMLKLGKVEGFAGQDPADVLLHLVDQVTKTVAAIESEARASGLIS